MRTVSVCTPHIDVGALPDSQGRGQRDAMRGGQIRCLLGVKSERMDLRRVGECRRRPVWLLFAADCAS